MNNNLQIYRRRIIDHLNKYFNSKTRGIDKNSILSYQYIKSLEEFSKRGKFLRGSLFLMTIEGLGQEVLESHLDIAVAIELMHTSLLIQDDVIDKDYLRRGVKTIFAEYEDWGEKEKVVDKYHFGITSAIIVSDIAFFYSMDLLTNFNDLSLKSLVKKFIYEVYFVILAEGMDSYYGQTHKDPSKDEIENIYNLKTARYTFSLPFELGAIVAKGSPEQQEILSNLGEMVGFIFQLKDDEIGLFGSEEKIGKPIGSDIRENKKTLIRYYLFDRASDSQKEELVKCFGKNKVGIEEIKTVKRIYNNLNIKDLIDNEIDKKMDRVWELFEKIDFKSKYKNALKDLINYNLTREY